MNKDIQFFISLFVFSTQPLMNYTKSTSVWNRSCIRHIPLFHRAFFKLGIEPRPSPQIFASLAAEGDHWFETSQKCDVFLNHLVLPDKDESFNLYVELHDVFEKDHYIYISKFDVISFNFIKKGSLYNKCWFVGALW